jgi:hypothetical protein
VVNPQRAKAENEAGGTGSPCIGDEMAVGRISGPLLKENLIRNGIDLAFETDLLYLDVNNQRIGIKTTSPTHELQISGTTKTTNLIVDTQANLADVTITGNTISSTQQYLNLGTLDNVVYQNKAVIDSIDIEGNVISTNSSNANLEFRPNGTGTVEVHADMNVTGNIHATGNITADGDITIGDANTDTIILNAEVASNIIPDADRTYNLGSDPGTGGKEWNDIYVNNFYASNIVSGSLDVDGIDLTLRQGNIIYVAENGSDANSGTHPQDPYASVVQALSAATAGDTIHIYPGVYTEIFPLTVPVGVTVKGQGLRSVTIRATTATRYNDAFLLNGESTVEDIMITGFYSGGMFHDTTAAGAGSATLNVGTAPFAHVYVSGGTITFGGTDYAITNAVYTHGTGQLVITHAGPDAGVGTSTFIKGIVFSCNGGNRTFPDNGYAFRFATDFTVITRSPYIRNITVITSGSTTTVEDPRGFNAGDAGKGAYIDGAYATSASKEASMLFHSATFITPGVDCITATNGVRVEWLNSFTYFANRSFYAYDSNDGKYGDGKTRIRVDGVTGTFAAGETVSYYDTDGVTLLESATIVSVDGTGKIVVSGKQTGFQTAEQRGGKTIVANGDAQLSTAVKKFGTASLALDGTGDYASIAASNDFGFGTDDFTIETFIYLNSLVGTRQLFDFRAGAVADVAPVVYISNGGQLRYYTDSADRIIGSTLLTGQWYHIALSRSSGTTSLYVNGIRVGTTYTDSNDYGVAKPLIIGARYDGGNVASAYFDEFRVIKGTAVTPPSGGPTTRALVTPETVLMARFDGENNSTTFIDDVVYAQDVRFSGGATATEFTLTDFTDFGAEVRMIGSASVYGNYGLVGDGLGVIVYAIGHNLAYIGNGKEVTNDPGTVIQANEVIELNGAKVRYNSVDHKGDFRVGDLFYVNQEDGTVSFSVNALNIDLTSGITFTTGGSNTFISGERIDTGNLRISGNTIESLSGDITFSAATDQINLQNNVAITGNLDVTGDVSIGGNIQIGDEATDSITIVAGINSNLIPATDNTYSLGTVSNIWSNLYVDEVEVDDITINTNVITTTTSNADLELRANGTGNILVPNNDVQIDNNLTVNGLTTLANTNITGTVTLVGDLTQTGDTDITGDLSITQTLTVDSAVQFEEILVEDNVITTTTSNADLDLRANGSGQIVIPNNDVVITNDLTINGTLTVANISVSGTVQADTFSTGNILIDDNYITTTVSNSNLELRANGSGSIVLEDFSFSSNVISTTGDLILQSSTEYVQINSTGALKLPVGTTAERPSAAAGQIRYNTDLTRFEGYNGTNWIGIKGVEDLDGNTRVTAELTEGANDNIIRFDIAGSTIIDIDSTRLNAPRITVDDIQIDGNVISTVTTDTNLEFTANGTGSIVFDNFAVKGNTITNTVANSITLFDYTGEGYVKFNGTYGMVLPVGTSLNRPIPAYTETGMMRFNTADARVEVFDGVAWVSVAGSSGSITSTDAQYLAIETVLYLG